MKEAKVRIEKNTDWLGTLKSLFGSSISSIDSESEFDKWQKAHAKDIAETDANISKLESELQHHDVKISKGRKKTEQYKNMEISEARVREEQIIENSEQKEHEDR